MVNVSQLMIEEILSDSIGDIRSTILNLIFASLKSLYDELSPGKFSESINFFYTFFSVSFQYPMVSLDAKAEAEASL